MSAFHSGEILLEDSCCVGSTGEAARKRKLDREPSSAGLALRMTVSVVGRWKVRDAGGDDMSWPFQDRAALRSRMRARETDITLTRSR